MSHLDKIEWPKHDPWVDKDLLAHLGCVGLWVANPHWCTGSVLRDLSGLGNHGELTNMAPSAAWRPRGMEFDGSNDQVDCGTAASLFPSGACTHWACVRPLQDERGRITSFGRDNSLTAPYLTFGLRWRHATLDWRVAGSPSNSYVDWATGVTITYGAWAVVAAVYHDPAIEFYLNGALVASDSWGGALATFTAGTRIARIGRESYYPHGGYEFRGTIAAVGVSGRALSAAELAEIHRDPFHMCRRPTRTIVLPAAGSPPAGSALPHILANGLFVGHGAAA